MAITTVKKGLIGVEDINFDSTGAAQQFQRERSDGTFTSMSKINASNIPLTSATRAQKTASDAALSATDVDAAIAEIGAELNQIGIPDGTILQFSAGTLQIAAASITNAKMAANSIDSDNYVDGSIDPAHLAADVINSGSMVADNVIDSEHIAAGSLDAEHYADDSIGRQHIDWDDNGTQQSHYIVAAGIHTASAAATHTISPTLPGGITLASGDIRIVTIGTQASAGSDYIINVADDGNGTSFTVTTSAALSASDTIHYMILKATADKTEVVT